MLLFAIACVWWHPPLHLFVIFYLSYGSIAPIVCVLAGRHAQRVMRETQGHVCRNCAYRFGEINMRICPECGKTRELDESSPLL
jgi:hypothetical protein